MNNTFINFNHSNKENAWFLGIIIILFCAWIMIHLSLLLEKFYFTPLGVISSMLGIVPVGTWKT